jgi:predicted permease
VTGDLFDVWGLRPHFGRGLRAGDDSPGAGRVVVLADHFWRQMFAAAPEVIGETVFIDGVAHEIVGVMSRDVEFANFADLAMWVPAALPGRADRDLTPLLVTGRLAPSATVENAHAELEIVAREIAAAHPETNRGRRSLVLTARRGLGGPNVVLVMTLLVGTATMVTVIAGVNVAGVLLSRAIVRQREFAMRMALGGRQARLYRQLIVEGLVLAGLGAAVGLLVASAGLRLIHSVDAEPIFQQFVIDWHEVTFVALVAMVSPLVFSLAPALAATRVDLLQTLNAGNARAIGSSRRGREILVTAQLALAVAMVVLGGLVARTAGSMIAAPAGFESANVVTFALALDSDADSAARRATLRQISDGLIKTGAFTTGALEILPATATEAISNVQPDSRIDTPGEAWAHVSHVDEHALTALGVAVVEGRLFTAQDIEGDADVALVSVEAARRYFGGTRDALGRTVTITGGSGPRVHRVIGVTGDVRNTDPERGMPPRVWVPMSDPLNVRFVVRTQGDVQTAAAAIRRVARDVVPGVPVETLETYDQAIARRNGGNRVAMGMLISFAIVALLFAATGLYGTVALSANMRRAEFATRFALGARVVDVAALVVGQAVKLLVIGGTVGFAGGMLAASGMRRLLFGVSPFDPLNLLTVFGLLTLVTLAASLAPAVRAARIDVMQTIRTE